MFGSNCEQRRLSVTELNISLVETRLCLQIEFHLPDKSGGLNGSMQHKIDANL